MKILTLTNLYPPHAIGGYEERCRQTVESLRTRGHEVRVLTSTYSNRASHLAEPHVRRELRIHGFFGQPWLPAYRLFLLERHNHRVLRAQLEEFQPDVVHVWNLGGLSKALMLTLEQWRGAVVYDVSDHWVARSLAADVWLRWWNDETGGPMARVTRRVMRRTGLARMIARAAPFAQWDSFRFRRLYFCSRSLRDLTENTGWKVGHAQVIPCAVDATRFAPRPASTRFERLLFVGRLTDDKDPLTAIRAVAALRNRGHDFTLDLYGAGDADYVQLLRDEAARLGIDDAICFLRASADAMPAVYSHYDALLFCSAWAEPFALTPLEAMAAKLPVIGTPAGGSLELFRDGENALVFPARDAAALANAVLRLAHAPDLRQRLAEAGHREVCTRYRLDAIIDRIEQQLEASRSEC